MIAGYGKSMDLSLAAGGEFKITAAPAIYFRKILRKQNDDVRSALLQTIFQSVLQQVINPNYMQGSVIGSDQQVYRRVQNEVAISIILWMVAIT
jgi:hypothetical protein